MKRAVLIVAAAALCVAGSAVAQDRSGLIGSGTRADGSGQVVGSGNAAGQTVGSGGFTTPADDSGSTTLTSGTRSSGQVIGSGGRATASGQYLGSGGRAADTSQTMDNGGFLGSGNRVPLFDGFSLLVVNSDEGTFVIPIED